MRLPIKAVYPVLLLFSFISFFINIWFIFFRRFFFLFFVIFTLIWFIKFSVYLQLQPRTFLYKRKQKSRKIYFFKKNLALFNFGSVSIVLLKPVFLTAKNLFRLKLFFKRASRKPDYTKRFVWLNAFPHLPLTKKTSGTRMGKGKGKLNSWYTHVYPGVSFCEFKNLRPGRSLYFSTQLHHKLGIDVKICFQTNNRFPFPLSLSQPFKHTVHW